MNFERLRDRIENLCRIRGWANSDPVPDYAYLANEGLRQFTQRAHHNTEDGTLITVLDQPEYAIDADDTPGWVLLYDDSSYGTDLQLRKVTEQKVRLRNPLWKHAESGTPRYIWLVNQNTVRLYAPPDTAGVTVYFRGVRHEPALIDDDQSPLVSEYYHEGIALFGAWSHGKTYATGDDISAVRNYLAEAEQYANHCKQQTAAADTEVFQRRKRRAAPEYMEI